MNILKLARHLKEFTIDEIEMVAECNCKTELERLLNKGKLVFEQDLYKYQEEKPKQEFIICTKQTTNYQVITFDAAVNYFLENYVKNNCKFNTYRRYCGILNCHISPFFKNKNLNDITLEAVKNSELTKRSYDPNQFNLEEFKEMSRDCRHNKLHFVLNDLIF